MGFSSATNSGHAAPTITLDIDVGYWPEAVDQTRSLVDGALGRAASVPD
ncbi:MAG TPA: hypothetical protein VFE65_21085 [Pseudonocardia sp.]|nr:hypothetical protein [Pseudonocardia sp.]